LHLHQNKLSFYIIIVYEIEMNAIPIAQETRIEYGSVQKKGGVCPVRNQAMKENLQKNTYSKLVKDITELYRAKSPENATVSPNSQNIAAAGKVELAYNRIRQPAAELWNTEQQGDGKVEYGVRFLRHLSEDLQRKLGSGFSKRNLYGMREFYLAYSILPAPAKLNWPIIEFRCE